MLENLLIARLPRYAQLRLLAMSEAVQLCPGDVLCEPGVRARCVYFPLDAIVSLVATVAGSRLLGVSREGVTEAAGELQQRLLIRYHSGMVCVLDRPGLESVACGCQAADQRAYNALLSP
ncbi:hypothetical protein [Azohydromonas lata]|uniref:Crp/Fnr family transcriptional regulator n=1 Tax=Azohydromonas lata TaxID=45677 RepID=A0ABU5IDC2_9BURK|nr:hypothetical protein [Azohydromonas lata]MDZ5456819.1 hypothetical protein [Azohydromonas lata]